MTYEEKKEWLRRYRKAAKLEKIKLEEVERYRTDAEHITQVLSPVPGGAGDGQALPRSVERITDAMQAANAQVMECQRICKEILSVMSQTVLDESARTAIKRPIGGGYGFGGDNTLPVEACALALWGVKTCKRDPTRKMRIG